MRISPWSNPHCTKTSSNRQLARKHMCVKRVWRYQIGNQNLYIEKDRKHNGQKKKDIRMLWFCRQITLIHLRLYLKLNNTIIWLSLDCPVWYFLSTKSEWTGVMHEQLTFQSSTGNIWQTYQKKLNKCY
jgi:hypothetical protein